MSVKWTEFLRGINGGVALIAYSGYELIAQRRLGAVGLWDFVLKSWPAVLGFFILVTALIASGKINL